MNKILLVFLLFSLVGLSRCKPEKDGPLAEEYVLTEADLIGSWTVERFSSEYYISGTFVGEDVNERGTSKIGNSDLELRFESDGSWTSSGAYSLTVANETQQEVTLQSGVGEGTWSFRSDTLYIDGLQNYGGNGSFAPRQACSVADFTQFIRIDFVTRIDQTDLDPDYDIAIRTEGDWKIELVR